MPSDLSATLHGNAIFGKNVKNALVLPLAPRWRRDFVEGRATHSRAYIHSDDDADEWYDARWRNAAADAERVTEVNLTRDAPPVPVPVPVVCLCTCSHF